VDYLHAQRGKGVNAPDSKPAMLFQECEDSAGAGSLFATHRQAELNLRRSLIGNRKGKGKSHFFDYIWLVYSFFFIIDPLQRHSQRAWVLFGLAYAAFLAIYLGLVYARKQRTQLLLLLGLLVLGIAYYPINVGASGMFIYVAAFIPFVTENIWLSSALIATSTILTAGEGWIVRASPWGWGVCAFFCITVGAANTVAAQKMRAGQKLGLAHEEIAHLAKVAERERIARDLHDVLGHTLSVVVLKSELAGKLMDRDPDRARREIGEVEQIARKALSDVREAISGYRAGGLAAEIARAQKTLDAAGVTLECESQPPQLPPAEETVLSLIVREAVTNIVRHAQASRCVLEISSSGDGTALVVQDDGRGGIRQEGNGLRGMRERAASIGATLRVDSAQGTRLMIQIPSRASGESPASPAAVAPVSAAPIAGASASRA
jgi:two-component system, NarL family, sensor histidine kinase DesK